MTCRRTTYFTAKYVKSLLHSSNSHAHDHVAGTLARPSVGRFNSSNTFLVVLNTGNVLVGVHATSKYGYVNQFRWGCASHVTGSIFTPISDYVKQMKIITVKVGNNNNIVSKNYCELLVYPPAIL